MINNIQQQFSALILNALQILPKEECVEPEDVNTFLKKLGMVLDFSLKYYIDILMIPLNEIELDKSYYDLLNLINCLNPLDSGHRNALVFESLIYGHNLLFPVVTSSHKDCYNLDLLEKSHEKLSYFINQYSSIVTNSDIFRNKLSKKQSELIGKIFDVMNYSLPLLAVNSLKHQLNIKIIKQNCVYNNKPLLLGNNAILLSKSFQKQYDWTLKKISFMSLNLSRRRVREIAIEYYNIIKDFTLKHKVSIDDFQDKVDKIVSIALEQDLVRCKKLLLIVGNS